MSRWMKLRLWISMTPLEVSRQISKKSLSSMCVFISMSLLSEQVPSSKSMYMVLKRSLSVSVSTCWHRFVWWSRCLEICVEFLFICWLDLWLRGCVRIVRWFWVRISFRWWVRRRCRLLLWCLCLWVRIFYSWRYRFRCYLRLRTWIYYEFILN